jgi:hypothetical protein
LWKLFQPTPSNSGERTEREIRTEKLNRTQRTYDPIRKADWKTRRDFLKKQTLNCVTSFEKDHYWEFAWKIGEYQDAVPCCRNGFRLFYGISAATLDNFVKEGKNREFESNISLTERNLPSADVLRAMELDAIRLGFTLDAESISAAAMSNDPSHKEAYTWLAEYIRLVGDKQPNRKNEIHLEYRTKFEIWREYRDINEALSDLEPISYQEFVALWKRCFSHVLIRKYKAVEAKCMTCCILTQLRSKARTAMERAECTKLHYWHR